jgi:hypothetical protein
LGTSETHFIPRETEILESRTQRRARRSRRQTGHQGTGRRARKGPAPDYGKIPPREPWPYQRGFSLRSEREDRQCSGRACFSRSVRAKNGDILTAPGGKGNIGKGFFRRALIREGKVVDGYQHRKSTCAFFTI